MFTDFYLTPKQNLQSEQKFSRGVLSTKQLTFCWKSFPLPLNNDVTLNRYKEWMALFN